MNAKLVQDIRTRPLGGLDFLEIEIVEKVELKLLGELDTK